MKVDFETMLLGITFDSHIKVLGATLWSYQRNLIERCLAVLDFTIVWLYWPGRVPSRHSRTHVLHVVVIHWSYASAIAKALRQSAVTIFTWILLPLEVCSTTRLYGERCVTHNFLPRLL